MFSLSPLFGARGNKLQPHGMKEMLSGDRQVQTTVTVVVEVVAVVAVVVVEG